MNKVYYFVKYQEPSHKVGNVILLDENYHIESITKRLEDLIKTDNIIFEFDINDKLLKNIRDEFSFQGNHIYELSKDEKETYRKEISDYIAINKK